MVTWFTSVSCYSTWAQYQPVAQETDTLCMMRHQISGQKSTCSMEPTSSHCSCSLTHYGSLTIRVLWDPFSSSTVLLMCVWSLESVHHFSICKRKIKGCGICSDPMSKHWTFFKYCILRDTCFIWVHGENLFAALGPLVESNYIFLADPILKAR